MPSDEQMQAIKEAIEKDKAKAEKAKKETRIVAEYEDDFSPAPAEETLHTAHGVVCAMCGDFGKIYSPNGITSGCPCHY